MTMNIAPKGNHGFPLFASEIVSAKFWGEMFSLWKEGTLRAEWASQHPDLFDSMDLTIATNQPNKHFAEWYAAILLKLDHGLLSLVEKYGHHGCKSHRRKQEVLKLCLSPEQHRFVITAPMKLLGIGTGWPDLFVYNRDYSKFFFCEVKGVRLVGPKKTRLEKDELRQEQILVFRRLKTESGIDIKMFEFEPTSNQ